MPLEINDWSLLPLGTPPQAFGPFEAVVAQWRGKRGEALVPRWGDYAVRDFAGWYGLFSLCRLTGGDAPDLHFEIYGTTIAEWVGHDLTGKTLRSSQLPLSEAYRNRFVAHFSAVVARPAIGLRRITLAYLGREHVVADILDLPVGKACRDPSHVLCFARRLPW